MKFDGARFRRRLQVALLGVLSLSAALVACGEEADQAEDPANLLNVKDILSTYTNQTVRPPSRDVARDAVPESDEDPLSLMYSKQGFTLMQERAYDEALEQFDKALEVDPKSRRGRFGRATVLIELGRARDAGVDFDALIEEYPNDYTVRNNLAWLFATSTDESMRDPERAVALAQEAVLMAPDDYHVWSTLAEALYVSAEYERAMRAAAEAVRLGVDQRLPPEVFETYRQQLARCTKAARALSVQE